jgi:cellulose biosynthesis protein BcsQ
MAFRRRLWRDSPVSTVLATYNIKGGVGKTSAAVNLAYLAAREGHPTLLWDLDPQAASTYLFRVKPKLRGGGEKLVRRGSEVAELIKGTDYPGLDLLPADFSLRHLDLALDAFKHPTRRLARVLGPLRSEYEYIFLDCAPSISLVSESVFEAAHALLVPIIPATLSSRTLEQLAGLVAEEDGAAGIQVLAFFSMVEVRKSLHREVMARVRAEYPGLMLGAAIPAADEIERMGEARSMVDVLAPGSRAAIAYRALWWDIRRRLSTAGARPAPR